MLKLRSDRSLKNNVVTVVLYNVFYQVKLNMRSKDSVIFQFLVSQITALFRG